MPQFFGPYASWASGGGGSFGGNLGSAYGLALQNNSDVYQQVLQSYSMLPQIYAGFDSLQGNIKDALGIGGGGYGVAAPAARDIERNWTKQEGDTKQWAINSGLGQTSVLGNLLNQATQYAGENLGDLGNKLAQTYVGQLGQVGLAKLQAMLGGQTNRANTFAGLKQPIPVSAGFGGGGGMSGGGRGAGGAYGGVSGGGGTFSARGTMGGTGVFGGYGGDHLGNLPLFGTSSNMTAGGYGGWGSGWGAETIAGPGGGGGDSGSWLTDWLGYGGDSSGGEGVGLGSYEDWGGLQ